MPDNTQSDRSCNWQENSLTVAVGPGQREERNNHAADPRATGITWLAAPAQAEACSSLLSLR